MGQTAWVWVGAVGGGRSADGGDGGCGCVGEVEKVECELAVEGREEGEAPGSPLGGYCGPPKKVVRDSWDGLKEMSPPCCV